MGTSVARANRGVIRIDDSNSRGEQMGSLRIKAPVASASISGVICETKVTVKMSPGPLTPRGAYPCGCGFCQEAAMITRIPQKVSPLAAIDVYDLPDGVENSLPEYFH
jgi:hypothetical protein